MSAHSALAAVAKEPGLALSEEEGRSLAQALSLVAEQYPSAVMSPKTIALLNLCGVSATIYGPRLLLLRLNAEAKRRERKRAASGATVDGVAEPVFA